MRSEQEMFDLILGVAAADERIRAVIMNGSRANPNAPKDRFQDYDIVYAVTELDTFTRYHSWIDIFGGRLMLQMPEEMRCPSGKGRGKGHFNYLMLFEDGSRIDLTLVPLTGLDSMENDSESVLLLDKDGILSPLPPASDADYHVKPPSELFFSSCCNNFWWCLQNVAKGIARDELPYAMLMFHNIVRSELHDMISWYIGIRTNFTVSTGKMGKYFKKYLPPRLYEMYVKTYSDGNYENLWGAIFTACDLFRSTAKSAAAALGLEYNVCDDENMTNYLHRVKNDKL